MALLVDRELTGGRRSIGLLPRYMSHFDRGLIVIPELLLTSLERQAWLVVNAAAPFPQGAQRLVDLIVSTFEGRKEWFA